MSADHFPHDKRGRRSEPSFWTYEPANDAVSLIENVLRGDKRADEPLTLREENAQLRKLVVQLSNLLGDLPVTSDETPTVPGEVAGGSDDVIVFGP